MSLLGIRVRAGADERDLVVGHRSYDIPRLLAVDEARDAAAAYHRAVARLAAAERVMESSPASREYDANPKDERAFEEYSEWQRWFDFMVSTECHAEDRMIAAVMAMCGRPIVVGDLVKLEPGWKPCVLELDDVLYVVQPADAEGGDHRPRLTLIDAIKDFDSAQLGL